MRNENWPKHKVKLGNFDKSKSYNHISPSSVYYCILFYKRWRAEILQPKWPVLSEITHPNLNK